MVTHYEHIMYLCCHLLTLGNFWQPASIIIRVSSIPTLLKGSIPKLLERCILMLTNLKPWHWWMQHSILYIFTSVKMNIFLNYNLGTLRDPYSRPCEQLGKRRHTNFFMQNAKLVIKNPYFASYELVVKTKWIIKEILRPI